MHKSTIIGARRATFVIALLLLFLGALPVMAADIKVEDGCTLRDAIRSANFNAKNGDCPAGGGPRDTIILTDHVSHRRILPPITSDIKIEGNGRMVTVRDDFAFVVDDAHLELRNVHIRFRSYRGDDVLQITDGSLTLANTIFHDCGGGMEVENSTLTVYDPIDVCGHGRDVIDAWFGIEPPVPPTCAMVTGATVTSAMGLDSGVQCQNVEHAGIGDESVRNSGYIDALDIWGYLGAGVEVCFPHIGAMIFLDAATAPRTVSAIASYGENGKTCASINRPGTVVLVPGQPTSMAPPADVSAPAPAPEPEPEPAPAVSEPAVDGCPIRATGHINYRAEPSLDGERIGYVYRGSTVGAVSRIRGWYQIIHLGRTGWIGGRYVEEIGDCQWPNA